MVEITKTLYVDSRAKWRRWLEKNHDRVREIWLLYAKKGSGKKRVDYADAVEEALCFGWIDGVVKPVDENFYAQRFTPRRAGSKWSKLNIGRYARLKREGKIAAPGLAKPPDKKRIALTPRQRGETVPPEVRKALRAVWAKFEKLPPSHRRNYIAWITDAKKAETRARRIAKLIDELRRR